MRINSIIAMCQSFMITGNITKAEFLAAQRLHSKPDRKLLLVYCLVAGTLILVGLLGDALEVVKAETVDLEVPARAELIIEGRVLPGSAWRGLARSSPQDARRRAAPVPSEMFLCFDSTDRRTGEQPGHPAP